MIMSFGYDADQASLHWNDMDYWSDEAAETAITDGDEDGCYWTGCMWTRTTIRTGWRRPAWRSPPVPAAKPSRNQTISMHVRAYPLIPFL